MVETHAQTNGKAAPTLTRLFAPQRVFFDPLISVFYGGGFAAQR